MLKGIKKAGDYLWQKTRPADPKQPDKKTWLNEVRQSLLRDLYTVLFFVFLIGGVGIAIYLAAEKRPEGFGRDFNVYNVDPNYFDFDPSGIVSLRQSLSCQDERTSYQLFCQQGEPVYPGFYRRFNTLVEGNQFTIDVQADLPKESFVGRVVSVQILMSDYSRRVRDIFVGSADYFDEGENPFFTTTADLSLGIEVPINIEAEDAYPVWFEVIVLSELDSLTVQPCY